MHSQSRLPSHLAIIPIMSPYMPLRVVASHGTAKCYLYFSSHAGVHYPCYTCLCTQLSAIQWTSGNKGTRNTEPWMNWTLDSCVKFAPVCSVFLQTTNFLKALQHLTRNAVCSRSNVENTQPIISFTRTSSLTSRLFFGSNEGWQTSE